MDYNMKPSAIYLKAMLEQFLNKSALELPQYRGV